MRYKFNDVDSKDRAYHEDKLNFEINGVSLDNKLPFFTTLNVFGRELISRNIATKNYSTGRSGGKARYGRNKYSTSIENSFIGSSVSQRQLTVQYRLKSKNEKEMIRNFEELQYLVNQEQAKLSFSDDHDYYYIGTLTGFDEVKSDRLDVIGKLMFECVDPYKYKKVQSIVTFNTGKTFKADSKYPVQLEEIEISPNGASYTELANSGDGSKIRILTSNRDKITIDMLDSTITDSSNRNRMKDLDIFSDLEDFAISNGDNLTLTGASLCTIKYRERGL